MPKHRQRSVPTWLEAEQSAKQEGPHKKTWTRHDIHSIKLLTDSQHSAFRAWSEGQNVALIGSAGTGKTLLATLMASTEVFDREGCDGIIIVRSPATAGEVGFLPGTLEEKGQPFEEAVASAFSYLFGRDNTYEDMKEAKKVDFRLTTHLRGLSWDNKVLIMEEVQNMTFQELYTVLTRVGRGTRVIMTGDTKQVDLTMRSQGTSGLVAILEILKDMRSIEVTEFTRHDIVRSEFVKSFISACEDRAAREGIAG